MQKVIIDTNVLVSSIIQKSYPFLIVSPKDYWENYRPDLTH